MNKKKYPIPATIVIRLNGDETTATLMGDAFTTRITRSLAKRNPKDEYDAYIGARVALDRLFDKGDMFADKLSGEPEVIEAKKEETRFQVGDIVRVTCAVLSFGDYMDGDVAVVTKIIPPMFPGAPTGYAIKVRSKERKGREGYAWEEELTLLHRAKGAEQA